MDIKQELDNLEKMTSDWLNDYDKIYPIKEDLNNSIQKLDAWILQWKQIYTIVRKKSYTLSDATALAAVFGCSIIRVGTKYNLVKDGKILFTGTLTLIVNYCFNNLVDLPDR